VSQLELELMRQEIAGHLEEVSARFAAPMRLTFVARHPDNPACFVIVSDDDMTGLRELFNGQTRGTT